LESLSFSLLAVLVRVLLILKSRVVSPEGHNSITLVLWRLKKLSSVSEVDLVCVIMLVVSVSIAIISVADISSNVIGGHAHSRIVLGWFHFNFSSSIIKGAGAAGITHL
jgi:hypothetical protein